MRSSPVFGGHYFPVTALHWLVFGWDMKRPGPCRSTARIESPGRRMAEPEHASPSPAASRETILIVEDEGNIRTLMVGVLKHQGYKVLAAVDGMEGLQISVDYANTIHLMICDFRMPRMTGGELIRR